MELVEFGLLLLVSSALLFVFGRNVHTGIKTGTVWLKAQRYHRAEQPGLFWFAVFASLLTAIMCFGCAVGAFCLLVTVPT